MTNATKQFRNDATAEEKLQTLFQDQALRNAQRRNDTGTFLSHTHSEEGGRYAKPQQVVGSAPTPEYPRQPDGSFSNQAAIVGDEPPYDGDMSTPIVGERWEVEASLERTAQEASPQSLDASPVRGAAGSLDGLSEVEPPLSPIPTNKRKR